MYSYLCLQRHGRRKEKTHKHGQRSSKSQGLCLSEAILQVESALYHKEITHCISIYYLFQNSSAFHILFYNSWHENQINLRNISFGLQHNISLWLVLILQIWKKAWSAQPQGSNFKHFLWDINKTKWCNGFYIEFRQNFAKESFSYDEHLKS